MSVSWISREVDMKVAAQIKNRIESMPKVAMPFITISREYGCDGWNLARALVDKLGPLLDAEWRLFHRDMLREVDTENKVTDEHLSLLEEFGHSDLQSYFMEAVFGLPSQVSTIHNLAKLFQILATKGNIVFLGGGSNILTRGLARGIHVRLYADLEWRVQNHAARWDLGEAEARKRVKARHKRREAFIKTFLGEDFRDVSHYHLLINNARMKTEDSVNLISQYLEFKYPKKTK